jgi:hypothetical protein
MGSGPRPTPIPLEPENLIRRLILSAYRSKQARFADYRMAETVRSRMSARHVRLGIRAWGIMVDTRGDAR